MTDIVLPEFLSFIFELVFFALDSHSESFFGSLLSVFDEGKDFFVDFFGLNELATHIRTKSGIKLIFEVVFLENVLNFLLR